MALVELQSRDHRNLLDVIDKLRSKGLSKYVGLPEIIVCGDQSAGKSSVLEAISGMSFPTKDNLCTRFATELILRRSFNSGVNISIIPGPDRSALEKDQLAKFRMQFDEANPDLGAVVESAKEAMGLAEAQVFSTDILRVELYGPFQPHLTLVDLPGLFRAGNMDQSVDDANTVQKMVRGYMKRPRSIILAVVSAKSDFALQEVTELARELDSKGDRTLGLITKPDTLDVGSDSEAAYVRLARNKDVKFRLGWHILKNRSYDMRGASSAERDEAEKTFFATGVWTTLNSNQLGANTLKPRLSNILKDQILCQLPSLLQEVESGISECDMSLRCLGAPRSNLGQQRGYLLRISQNFTALLSSAVNGTYADLFFVNAKTDKEYKRRLRAVVQNTLADFAEEMRLKGQSRVIVDVVSTGQDLARGQVSRQNLANEVKTMMRRNRGRELPGLFNPIIIGELFIDQCRPWRKLSENAKDSILQAVYQAVYAILDNLVPEDVVPRIFRIISGGVDKLRDGLDRKLSKLLDQHSQLHPITYNHYLTDNVQKAQSERRRRKLEKSLKSLFGVNNFQSGGAINVNVNPSDVLRLLDSSVEVDMEILACESIIDYTQAYYKVALKDFVDNFSRHIIEAGLMQELPALFTPEMVYQLTDDDIARLASESEDSTLERATVTERLATLKAGLLDLKRLDKHGVDRRDIEEGGSTDDDTVMGSSTAEGSTGGISPDLEDPRGQLGPSWLWGESSQHKVEESRVLVAPELKDPPSNNPHGLGIPATKTATLTTTTTPATKTTTLTAATAATATPTTTPKKKAKK